MEQSDFALINRNALHQSLRCPCGHHLPNEVPAEAQRSGFGGERRRKGVNSVFAQRRKRSSRTFRRRGRLCFPAAPQMQREIIVFCQGKRIATSLLWQLLAMTRWKIEDAVREPLSRLWRQFPLQGSLWWAIAPPRRGSNPSRRDTTTARQGDFIRCRKANALGGTLAEFHFATGKISPPKGISLRAACRPLTRSR